MSANPLVTNIIAAFVLAAIILYRYGDWYRHHIIVTLVVLVAWCFSFLIIFILPLDVSSAVYRQCRERYNDSISALSTNVSAGNGSTPIPPSPCLPPWSYVPDKTFPSLWRVVYWSTQFLTWLIMPLMQSYTQAGDFTISGKLRSAAIDNAIYYGTYLLIAGILLIYIATKPGVELDWPKLKVIASSASNTWGLFLLVLLLGHALVEIPRGLWKNSKPGYTLQYTYFRVSKISEEKCEAELEVEQLLESLRDVVNAVKPGHPLYPHVEDIRQKVPVELMEKTQRRNRDYSDSSGGDIPSEKTLIRLHVQLKKALCKLHRTEAQWNIIVNKSIFLEDIERRDVESRRFRLAYSAPRSNIFNFIWTPTVRNFRRLHDMYYFYSVHRYVLRFLAVVTGILSVAVIWSEVTFFKEEPKLSLFAVLLDLTFRRYDYYAMELLSTGIIAYLCYCAYSTVLQIKFWNKYYIAPNHQTDEYSLIFSGMMLCRLTPPMCLNFLGMIHMDSHIIKTPYLETAYTQIMGHMDVISIISDGFNIYFPMLMLLFCCLSYFSVRSKLLSSLGIQQFMEDEFTMELVEDGKEHIKRERKRLQRLKETEERRQQLGSYARDGAEVSRGRDRRVWESDRGRPRDDSLDSARAGLLAETNRQDYYVQPSSQNDATLGRDRAGRLPKGFFDDV